MNIRLFKPSLGKEELENISQAFDRSWVGLGPNVNEFESRWAEFVGVKNAIGLNSATAALHIALLAFDFPKGKNIYFGIREHAMASISNAIALYGPLMPFTATFFVFSDYLKPAVRIAALAGIQQFFIWMMMVLVTHLKLVQEVIGIILENFGIIKKITLE